MSEASVLVPVEWIQDYLKMLVEELHARQSDPNFSSADVSVLRQYILDVEGAIPA